MSRWHEPSWVQRKVRTQTSKTEEHTGLRQCSTVEMRADCLCRRTVALCGRANLINHCQTSTRPLRINAWLSHPDWRAQPRHAERSHRTAPKHLRQTRKKSRDRACTHMQLEAEKRLDAGTTRIETRLSVCERPSGSEPVKAIPEK